MTQNFKFGSLRKVEITSCESIKDGKMENRLGNHMVWIHIDPYGSITRSITKVELPGPVSALVRVNGQLSKQMTEASSCSCLLTPSFPLYRFVRSRIQEQLIFAPFFSNGPAQQSRAGPSCDDEDFGPCHCHGWPVAGLPLRFRTEKKILFEP